MKKTNAGQLALDIDDPNAHALLPPSASSRWVACPPSMAYVRALIADKIIKKRISGPLAERGTRVHSYGESIVKWTLMGKQTGSLKGDATEIAEGRDYAEYCVALFHEFKELLDPHAVWGAEDRAHLDKEFCWGSRDFWLHGANYLIVVDLKTGRDPVTVKGNTQLLIYAVDKFEHYQPKFVEIAVFQPNSDDGGDHVKSHVYTAAQMREKIVELTCHVESAKLWFDVPYRQMEKALVAGAHCGYCDALGVCPKAKAYATSISRSGFEPVGRRK
jgi:hypothetical protein